MRYFLMLAIRIYWGLIPESKRRNCLFRESCSRHVYRILKTEGIFKGIKAFKKRYKQCRPGFQINKRDDDGKLQIRLVDGAILNEDEISLHINSNY